PRPLRLCGELAAQRPWGENIWSTANVGEVLPGVVTPLTGSGTVAGLPIAFLSNFRRMGLSVSPRVPLLREFFGRFYFNLAAIQWISWYGWGVSPADTNRTMGGNPP